MVDIPAMMAKNNSTCCCSTIDLQSLENRRKTLEPLVYYNQNYLLNAGLFYCILENKLKCYSCEFKLDELHFESDILLLHSIEMPHCKYIREIHKSPFQLLNMSEKSNRLLTLNKWPVSFLDKETIADLGFYYTGNGNDDLLECIGCNKTFGDWQIEDDPLIEHNKLVQECPFNTYQKEKSLILKFDLTSEEDRISTFNNFGFQHNFEKMVKSALYFTGNNNVMTVECFACHYSFQSLSDEHDVDKLHKEKNPNCLFMMWKYRKSHSIKKVSTENLDLLDVKNRLKTLEPWPIFFINKNDVAQSGFYHTGSGFNDAVKCVYCKCIYKHFTIGDDPYEIHERLNPNCEYMKMKKNNSIIRYSPVHPQYGTTSKRIDSFKNWPVILNPILVQLAEAGFVYSGTGDNVFCYNCNVSLSEWPLEETPWIRHASSSPDCSFILLSKGESFINEAIVVQFVSGDKTIASDEDLKLKIDDARLCKICYAAPITTVFDLCGHSIACYECAYSVDKCPYCRKRYDNIISINTHF